MVRCPLRVLLVDDDELIEQTVGAYLRRLEHQVDWARDGHEGLRLADASDYDLALVDMRLPGMDGLTLLSKIQEIRPETSVVMVTGYGNMEVVIEALRAGAADFLTKPLKLEDLDATVEKAVRIRDLRTGQRRLRQTIGRIQATSAAQDGGARPTGDSKETLRVRELIQLAAEGDCPTVLITGETGTGKEVVARELHRLARGDERPFIAVSCPALPDSLVESELFGHVRGAFTGAQTDKPGCFELADGGTLFLDEIADLSPSAQAKLLRVLETRRVRRVGGAAESPVDVSVVAATNVELERLVEQRDFRRDLFYRLNVFGIHLAPLRERREDIGALADCFLTAYRSAHRRGPEGFTEGARAALAGYDYPGNCRELRNLVERAAMLCRSEAIDAEDLDIPRPSTGAKQAGHGGADAERARIRKALDEARWNRREAARALGMAYSTLRYKMQKLGIE